jgi:hypothetical protein
LHIFGYPGLRVKAGYFMGVWRQIAEYLYIKKRDPNEDRSGWLRYMHGINRISILMFLTGLIIIIIRALFFKRH